MHCFEVFLKPVSLPQKKGFDTGFAGLFFFLCFEGGSGGDPSTDGYSSSLELKAWADTSLDMGLHMFSAQKVSLG